MTLLDRAIVRLLPAVPKPVVQLFSARYIAGSTLADAVRAVKRLNAEGKLATIFVDRVKWLAAQAGADGAAVLGFAVAHEIGHLLLGTNAHGSSGLMRALWSRGELQHTNVKDWLFSRDEGARMRASLERRNGLRFSEHDATGCTASRGGDADASAGCRPAAVAAALRGVAAGADR